MTSSGVFAGETARVPISNLPGHLDRRNPRRHRKQPRSNSRLPSPRVLPPVDGQDDDVVVGFLEVQDVRKPIQDGAPRFPSHESKSHRVVCDAFDRFVQAPRGTRPQAQAADLRTSLAFRVLRLSASGLKLTRRLTLDPAASGRTSSHGMADSGR